MTHDMSLKFFVCLFIIYTFVGKHFDCCNIISFHPKIFGSLLGVGKVFFHINISVKLLRTLENIIFVLNFLSQLLDLESCSESLRE